MGDTLSLMWSSNHYLFLRLRGTKSSRKSFRKMSLSHNWNRSEYFLIASYFLCYVKTWSYCLYILLVLFNSFTDLQLVVYLLKVICTNAAWQRRKLGKILQDWSVTTLQACDSLICSSPFWIITFLRFHMFLGHAFVCDEYMPCKTWLNIICLNFCACTRIIGRQLHERIYTVDACVIPILVDD